MSIMKSGNLNEMLSLIERMNNSNKRIEYLKEAGSLNGLNPEAPAPAASKQNTVPNGNTNPAVNNTAGQVMGQGAQDANIGNTNPSASNTPGNNSQVSEIPLIIICKDEAGTPIPNAELFIYNSEENYNKNNINFSQTTNEKGECVFTEYPFNGIIGLDVTRYAMKNKKGEIVQAMSFLRNGLVDYYNIQNNAFIINFTLIDTSENMGGEIEGAVIYAIAKPETVWRSTCYVVQTLNSNLRGYMLEAYNTNTAEDNANYKELYKKILSFLSSSEQANTDWFKMTNIDTKTISTEAVAFLQEIIKNKENDKNVIDFINQEQLKMAMPDAYTKWVAICNKLNDYAGGLSTISNDKNIASNWLNGFNKTVVELFHLEKRIRNFVSSNDKGKGVYLGQKCFYTRNANGVFFCDQELFGDAFLAYKGASSINESTEDTEQLEASRVEGNAIGNIPYSTIRTLRTIAYKEYGEQFRELDNNSPDSLDLDKYINAALNYAYWRYDTNATDATESLAQSVEGLDRKSYIQSIKESDGVMTEDDAAKVIEGFFNIATFAHENGEIAMSWEFLRGLDSAAQNIDEDGTLTSIGDNNAEYVLQRSGNAYSGSIVDAVNNNRDKFKVGSTGDYYNGPVAMAAYYYYHIGHRGYFRWDVNLVVFVPSTLNMNGSDTRKPNTLVGAYRQLSIRTLIDTYMSIGHFAKGQIVDIFRNFFVEGDATWNTLHDVINRFKADFIKKGNNYNIIKAMSEEVFENEYKKNAQLLDQEQGAALRQALGNIGKNVFKKDDFGTLLDDDKFYNLLWVLDSPNGKYTFSAPMFIKYLYDMRNDEALGIDVAFQNAQKNKSLNDFIQNFIVPISFLKRNYEANYASEMWKGLAPEILTWFNNYLQYFTNPAGEYYEAYKFYKDAEEVAKGMNEAFANPTQYSSTGVRNEKGQLINDVNFAFVITDQGSDAEYTSGNVTQDDYNDQSVNNNLRVPNNKLEESLNRMLSLMHRMDDKNKRIEFLK